MFNKILFATSATEACDHAARVAFAMAEKYNAHLEIFHVLGLPTRAYSQVVIEVKTRERIEIDEGYCDWVKEEVRMYYERFLEKLGDRYAIEVAIGVTHREILRTARNTNPDLIVMGGSTHHLEDSAYRQLITGSTFQRVSGAAHCPVLVVTRPAASFWGGFSKIVVGTDFSESADAAVDYGIKLARSLDCELSLFHAVDISGLAMGQVMIQDDIEEKLRVARKKMRYRYLPKLEGFTDYSIDAWEGIPYMEIVKYTREKQADLVIMAHHARRFEEKKDARMGSNLEQVIVRAGCPVLSINRTVGRQVDAEK